MGGSGAASAAAGAMPQWAGGLGEKFVNELLRSLVRRAEGAGKERLEAVGVRSFLADMEAAARAELATEADSWAAIRPQLTCGESWAANVSRLGH